MGWRGFGFVHCSRTSFCRAVPNPNITIRNFFIAVRWGVGDGRGRQFFFRVVWMPFSHREALLERALEVGE
jgi:hypothetical protein